MPGPETHSNVLTALRMGYRHIDTAQGYGNEQAVGSAVRGSGLSRDVLFITTKLSRVFVEHVDYDQVLETLRSSLSLMRMDYVDLYLIHSPYDREGRIDQWRALESAKQRGLARSIGVSIHARPPAPRIASR